MTAEHEHGAIDQPSAEQPPTYTFAIALTILLAVLLFFSTWPLIGAWAAEVVVVLLVRFACLAVLVVGVRQLLAKNHRAVRTLCVAIGVVWLNVIIEGALVWGDIGWFLGKLTDEPLYGALAASLIVTVPIIVLLFVRPTQRLLRGTKSE